MVQVHIIVDRDTGLPRGFAFVEMANVADGEKAIAEVNGTEFGGRTLSVNERVPDQSAPSAVGKAESAAEAADAGNHEATISSEHLMRGSPKRPGGCHVEMASQT